MTVSNHRPQQFRRRDDCVSRLFAVQLFGIAVATAVLLSPLAASAQTWNATYGDWSNADDWTGGPPTSGATAFISNGGTVTVTTTGNVVKNLYIGPGTVDQSGGNLTVSPGGAIFSESLSSLTYNISGGTLYAPQAQVYYNGSINQSGGECVISTLLGAYTITSGTLQANYLGTNSMTVSEAGGNGTTLVTVGSSGDIHRRKLRRRA